MTTKDKALDKLRKLLELSKSSNEHEAALAAARAADIMLQFQISEAELDSTDATVDEMGDVVADAMTSKVAWKGALGYSVASGCGCRMYWSYIHDTNRGRSVRTIQIFGGTTDVQTARYLYSYLAKELTRLAKAAYDPDADPLRYGNAANKAQAARTWQNSFKLGACAVIEKRLKEQREVTVAKTKTDGKTKALVVLQKQAVAVKSAWDAKISNWKSGKASKATVNHSAMAQGAKAANSIALGGGANLGGRKPSLCAKAKALGSGK